MPRFDPGQSITSDAPRMQVDAGLPPGVHRFQLVVIDADGNRSAPAIEAVTVRRLVPPTPGPVVDPFPGPVFPEPVPTPVPIPIPTPGPVRQPAGPARRPAPPRKPKRSKPK